MRIKVKVPRLGLTIEEVTLSSWERAVGDQVAEGDVIAVVEADKANFEIVAPAAGVLEEQECAVGEMKAIGETLAVIVS